MCPCVSKKRPIDGVLRTHTRCVKRCWLPKLALTGFLSGIPKLLRRQPVCILPLASHCELSLIGAMDCRRPLTRVNTSRQLR